MIRMIAVSTLAAAFSLAAAGEAGAWQRSGSVTGPRGTTTYGGSGSCSGGSCSWQRGGTGPHGYSWGYSGAGTCTDRTCSYSGTGTGSRGRTYNRGGSLTW